LWGVFFVFFFGGVGCGLLLGMFCGGGGGGGGVLFSEYWCIHT